MKKNKTSIMTLMPECPWALIDDAAFRRAMKRNKVAAKKIIAPVIGRDDFEVKSIKVQDRSDAIRQHSVYFDATVLFSDGTHIVIEVQKRLKKMPVERVLYYYAMARASFALKKGEEDYTKSLPCLLIIFADGDMFGMKKPLYTIHTVLMDNGRVLDPYEGVYVVNVKKHDMGTDLGRLVRDMVCNKIDEIVDPDLRKALNRVHLKWKKGDPKMSDEMKAIMIENQKIGEARGEKRGEKRGQSKTVMSLLCKGHISIDVAAEELGISVAEVQKLLDKQKKQKPLAVAA